MGCCMINYTDMDYLRFSDKLEYEYCIIASSHRLDWPCNDRV